MKNNKWTFYRIIAIICAAIGACFLIFSMMRSGTRYLSVGLLFVNLGQVANILAGKAKKESLYNLSSSKTDS